MNEFQKLIIQEYLAGLESVNGQKERKNLIKTISEKYGITMGMTEGIAELTAVEGLIRRPTKDLQASPKWTPINYHAAFADLKRRTEDLERKFGHILDGLGRVIEDGEIMGSHLANLRKMEKWLHRQDAINVRDQSKLISKAR